MSRLAPAVGINKRILLIMPPFFGYQLEIESALKLRGFEVDWIPDRPFNSALMKAITAYQPNLLLPLIDRYYQGLLLKFGRVKYDEVLIINGQTVSFNMLNILRSSFPNAKFTLYMWDSIENRPGVVKNLSLFDKLLSFDPESAKLFGMKLRPLFFSKGFEVPYPAEMEYDLSFIGTVHSDRYSVISKIQDKFPADNTSYWYLYLQAYWVYWAYLCLKPEFRSSSIGQFKFRPLPKSTLQSIFFKSRTILDIEHPLQSGLTMRTFEAVGARKKLITTNRRIAEYDFYNDQNICIIDRVNPSIEKDFYRSPFKPLDLDIYHRYSIDGWLDEVLI